MDILRRFSSDNRGDGAVEYALLAGLIACVVISALQKVGLNLNNKFKVLQTALS